MKEIEEIIYVYSINKKILDEKAIIYLTNIILTSLKLDSYIENIQVLDKYDKGFEATFGAYIDKTKTILINQKEHIISHKDKTFIPYSASLKKFSNTDLYFITNLKILQTIVHECVHAKQRQNYEYNLSDSLPNKIMNEEISYFYINRLHGYKKDIRNMKSDIYYDYQLIERSSEINALKIVKTIISHYKDLDIVKIYEELQLKESYICGYEKSLGKIISPTNRILKTIKSNIQIPENLSYEDRLKYGFNITKQEYKELEEEITKLEKKLQ